MMGLRTLASLAVAAVATTALAHTQDGTLGDTAASTDYYQITCSDDGSGVPASMIVQCIVGRRRSLCLLSCIGVRPRPQQWTRWAAIRRRARSFS